MRRLLVAFVVAGLIAMACGSADSASAAPPTEETVGDSIVRIVGFGCGAPALGSGFAVRPDLVVTSGHLVTGRDPDTLAVIRPSGEELPAVLVGFDLDLDLAVLRVDDAELVPVELIEGSAGDVGMAMRVGSEADVSAVPFEVDARVSVNWDGVFRDTESRFEGLRINAEIERGDSGSGLFVSDSEVIGLVHSKNRNGLPRAYAVGSAQITEYLETIDVDEPFDAPRCA